MWNRTYEEDLIENVTVARIYKDGVHKANELTPHEGYAMHLIGDNGYNDENVSIKPYYCLLAILPLNADIYAYEAVLITPDMKIQGKQDKLEVE